MAESPEVDSTAPRLGLQVAREIRELLGWEFVFLGIVFLGALLRFHGLGWDQPGGANAPLQMHPDERFLSIVSSAIDWPDSAGGYFDTDDSPLNPYNTPDANSYVYGTFPLFLNKGLATAVDREYFPLSLFDNVGLNLGTGDPPGAGNSYDATVIWGRRLTALIDTLTIALVFALAASLFDRRVGLLAALAYSLAVLPTQLAHFFAMDPYVTFFTVATMLAVTHSVTATGWRRPLALCLLTGAAVGLGLASKVTAWPLLMLPVLATALRIGLRDFPGLDLRWRRERPRIDGHFTSDIAWLAATLIVGAIVFRVAQPYAFASPDFGSGPGDLLSGLMHLFDLNPRWRADLEREIDFQNGNVDFPPFVQFAAGTPFLTPLKNMILWGLGPALGLTGWIAAVGAAVMVFRRRDLPFVLPLALMAGVFLFQGPRFVAFMRYFVPMYPMLTILAAWGAMALWDSAANGDWRASLKAGRWVATIGLDARERRWIAGGLIVVVLAASAWWAMAFQRVYFETHPRIAASEWIYANVPPGSAITFELWDDSVPYAVPGSSAGQYTIIGLSPYHPDSPQKVADFVYGEAEADGPSGLLGADYIAVTSNRVRDSVPNLEREYPATIRYYELLETGELGFKRVATFKVHPSFLGVSFNDSSAEESFTVYDHPEVRIYKKADTFDADRAYALLSEARPEAAINLLPKQGRTNALEFTDAEAAKQQAGGTFSKLFDRDGWGGNPAWLWWFLFLELAAVAAVPWLTWIFHGLPDRGYGLSKLGGFISVALTTWLIVAWGVADYSRTLVWLVFGGVLIAGAAGAYLRRASLLPLAREHWRSWLAFEAIFVIAFVAFLLIRAFNPDVWHHPQGGEKPMELAYLTAVARSTEMPPYDPWFAGGSMNYYYMGWFFLSIPMRALRIVPEIGFNLGIATYAAMAATVAASTGHNLLRLSTRASFAGKRLPIVAALLGAVFLVGIANLDGGHQLIERLQHINEWGLFEGTPVIGGLVGILGGLWQFVTGTGLPGFDWWRSSRVHIGAFDITEFPFWSFLFADLHPHLMDLPFFGFTIATAVAYIASATRPSGEGRAQTWALAAGLGLMVGLVRTVHTWDFPTAALLMVAAIAAGQLLASGRWQIRSWIAVAHVALAAAVLTVAFAPFMAHFEVFESGLDRAPETTKPYQYFAHFGLFISIAVAFLAVRYWEELRERGGRPGGNVGLMVTSGRWELLSLAAFTAGLATFTWQFGVTVVALSALGIAFFANVLWLEWRREERDLGRMLATGLFIGGLGIAAGVDVVTVNNDIVRMNTVFKFSLQAWQLYALASAYAVCYVGAALWTADGWRFSLRRGRRLWGVAATAVFGVLLFGSVVFLWSGVPARQEARFNPDLGPTLDGFAFLPYAEFREDQGDGAPDNDVTFQLEDDAPLVEWLRDNVEGSPVIVEAVGPLYHWTGRISMLTGLPAVIGWDWHQTQQRWEYGGLVQERRAETQQFWQSGDEAFAQYYLRKYSVRYVVVGTEEYAFASREGLAKLARMEAVTEVFHSGKYAIYEVEQAALPAVDAGR